MATFPNYLQRAAAEIAKATLTKRLELASNYADTINNIPGFGSAKEATMNVNAGKIPNGSLYKDKSFGGALAIAKGTRKKEVIIKDPVKKA